MCEFKHGHDYSKDARLEMEGNGDRWFSGMGLWLKEHWQTLLVVALVLGWVVRMEVFAQEGPRVTPADIVALEARWEKRFDDLPPDHFENLMDERFRSAEVQRANMHEDIRWIKEQLLD